MEGILGRGRRLVDNIGQRLVKSPVKEACAEFLGTFVLVFLGDSVMAGCTLWHLGAHSVLVGAVGWGLALMVAVSVAGGTSGGHVNPAVTLGLATVKKCGWKNVLPNMIAHYLSSLLAAAAVFFTYRDAINNYDGGYRQIPPAVNATSQIFATYPQDHSTMITCIWDQVIGTALLLIVICAATDRKNLNVPTHGQPLVIGLGLTAIALALGHNCGAPLNPARDLAPRVFTAAWGWGLGVFSYRNYEWFWIPVIAPYLGGIIGVWLYRIFIELPIIRYEMMPDKLESFGDSTTERCRFSSEVNPAFRPELCPSLDDIPSHPLNLNYSAIADHKTLNDEKNLLVPTRHDQIIDIDGPSVLKKDTA